MRKLFILSRFALLVAGFVLTVSLIGSDSLAQTRSKTTTKRKTVKPATVKQASIPRGTQLKVRLETAIDTKGKKLNQITDAEDKVDETSAEHDAKKIENMALQDQVNFSTITLQIYQRETVKQEIVANEKDASAYEPPLGLQLVDSIKSGWYILESLLVFVVQIWSLILLGFLIFLLFKKYRTKVK